MGLGLKSNPVASELILPTAFETAPCRFRKINRGRKTALRCHLVNVAGATGNEMKSKKPGWAKKSWISLRNIDAGFRHFDFAECAEEAQPPGFLAPRASNTGVISIPVTPEWWGVGRRESSVGECGIIDLDFIIPMQLETILISGNEQANIREQLGVSVGVSTNLIISANCRLI